MYDWKKIVRERLRPMHIPLEQQEEVVAELAGHLEDMYQQELAAGVNSVDASKHVLEQDSSWHSLPKNIERGKRKELIMNHRTRQIWIPGLLGLFVSLAWDICLQTAAAKIPGVPFNANTVWLLSLPFIGAACGYLSRRAGSGLTTLISAAVFPSFAMALVWLVVLVVVKARRDPFESIAFGNGFLHAVVIPAAALLVGALLFIKSQEREDFSGLSR